MSANLGAVHSSHILFVAVCVRDCLHKLQKLLDTPIQDGVQDGSVIVLLLTQLICLSSPGGSACHNPGP